MVRVSRRDRPLFLRRGGMLRASGTVPDPAFARAVGPWGPSARDPTGAQSPLPSARPAPDPAVRPLARGCLRTKGASPWKLCLVSRAGPALTAPGSSAWAGRSRRGSASLRSLSTRTSLPVVSQAVYFRTAAEIGGRIHRARFDDLLAPLPGCFAQFPHGTCVLSGSQLEI